MTHAQAAGDRGLEPAALPTGTLTFLFTDIEGSTRLLQELGDPYGPLLATHRRLIVDAAAAHGGRVMGTEGDAVFLVFEDAPSAIRGAVDAQRALANHDWPDGRAVRVRMGIHTGEAQLIGGTYVGLALHQVARISAAGHGGQVLVSSATRGLVANDLPAGVLLRDLGEHRLKDLANRERLFEVAIADLDRSFPPLRTLEARPNNLPVQLTTFVGRRELEAARRLLAGTRLLTLTGPGGTGKTRLALQLAAEAVDDYPDGVFFVPLDSVLDPELVPSAIAESFRLEPSSAPPLERLVDHLRGRRLLLVLDNFEQVVDAAPVVARLLREAPQVKAIVTSRSVLRTSGEQEYPVPPLALPAGAVSDARSAADSEAILLFVERAMAVQPSFALSDDDAAAIADIVARLDGLPLAIELAAARVRILPVEALRDRLTDRLGTLVGGARDLPARQQTLRGAIDWSYALLDAPDRRLLERFAVFAGSAGLGQAEAVCGPAEELGRDVLDGLTSLVEKSLLRADPDARSEPRFSMLATIRAYAGERLAAAPDASAVRRRHAEAYLALAEQAAPELTRAGAPAWLDRLALDHDNLRAALDWAVAGDEAELGLRLIVALWRFWQIRGLLFEAEARVGAVLALPGVAGQPAALRSRGFGAAGSIAWWRGAIEAMRGHYRTALAEARASGDRAALAEALYNQSFAGVDASGGMGIDVDAARESLAVFRELGDDRGIASAMWALGTGLVLSRAYDEAHEVLLEALEVYRRLDDGFGIGWALHDLGLVEALRHRPSDAVPYLREALEVFAASSDLSGIGLVLGDFALVARDVGDEELFWRLGGAYHGLRRSTGADLGLVSSESLGFSLPDEPPADDEAALRAFTEGSLLSPEQAIALAREASLV